MGNWESIPIEGGALALKEARGSKMDGRKESMAGMEGSIISQVRHRKKASFAGP